jgi:transcription-repair coupling factor (superfamily II helicase)
MADDLILSPLFDSKVLADLCDQLACPSGAAAYEICEGARAALAAAIAQKTGRQVLYVAPGDRDAARAAEDISQYLPQGVSALIPRERQFARAVSSREGEWQRLTALQSVQKGDTRVLCISADALLWRMTPPETVRCMTIELHTGDVLQPADLMARLAQAGYERVDMVEGKGQCALRGAIVDVYPPCETDALRIEFFDDEIDGMRSFDCVSQRSSARLESACITPAGEYLLAAEDRPKAGASLRLLIESALDRLREHPSQKKLSYDDNSQDSRDGLRSLLREAEALEAGGLCRGMDLFVHILLPRTCGIWEYLDNPIVLIDTPDRCRTRMDDCMGGYLTDLSLAIEREMAIPEQEGVLRPVQEALDAVNACDMLSMQEFLRDLSGFKQGKPMQITALDAPQYHSSVRDLAADLAHWRQEGGEIFLLSGGEARGERLLDTLHGVDARMDDHIHIYPHTLSRGFTWPACGLYVIGDTDIYGAGYKKTRTRKNSGQRIEAFTDLREGDYVVHEMHGVGVYQGVKRIQSEGVWRDYLLIQYKDNDRLYVPTDQFDRVQKYIGSTDGEPPLNSLSGGEWQKQKAKVKAGLKTLAFNLVQLYAQREATPGHAFAPDTAWTQQFDELFPYELTPDQARAVDDIRRDMESTRNMDRLLCGDVGYGKTEVAMRAAFKAVQDGKQVAILAPTTILAQQHYYTCLKRFHDFPVNIDVISRFRTPKAQREAIARAAAGKCDILIGTHRLLSKDVQFKDLGLLIVDEEQRFGVAHKESIKNLKKSVDVLTLSATPIPRTLHMSMVGVRDMSLLETPPEERIPVQTYVMDYNESLVRDAILREIARDGQVYFLYNRVANIDAFAARLRQLVPEARIGIGHGQMQEHALEDVMLDFYAGKYDVLLCSTIIENGLDVPRANTMIVYDADRFGLSQLYQLRGRVGRSNRVSYAYFTVQPQKMLSETAEKRLAAIREFTQFGAGFRIAMRDLEIRGAGDIFGPEQSGHISVVGYDMYCKLIEEAVREAKGEINAPAELEPRVDLKVNAYLPEAYVHGGTQRVEVYKRISMLRTKEDMRDIIDELLDRFGDIPQSVLTLLDVAYLRALCVSLGVGLVQRQPTGLLLRFDEKYLPDLNALSAAMGEGGTLRFSAARIPGLFLPLSSRQDDETALKAACDEMSSLREKYNRIKTAQK